MNHIRMARPRETDNMDGTGTAQEQHSNQNETEE